MKKRLFLSLCLLFCCAFGLHAKAIDDTPKLYSRSACVIDADTGEILYQKRANEQMRPASITKQMTALLVLEHIANDGGSLEDKVKVTDKAMKDIDPESTRIGFVAGQKRTVRDLMNCMLIESANDAANILATYVDKDVDTFVDHMNKRAEQLGCTNTHFSNPNGLDPDDDSIHLSTAHDMALISLALTAYPDYFEFAGATEYLLDTDKVIKEPWGIATKVDMLNPEHEYYNKEVYAGKTGWTSKANHTMCLYMKRGDRNVVMCVMNSPEWTEKYKDCEALMDYVCNNYSEVPISSDEAIALVNAAGLDVTLDQTALSEQNLRILIPETLTIDDLKYSAEMLDDGETPALVVGIADEALDKFQAATHMKKNADRLLVAPLPVSKGLVQQVVESEQGSGSAVVGFGGISFGNRTTLLITLLAALLVLISIFFLIFRSVRRRKKTKKEKPLVVVIPTPEQYRDKEEK